MLALLVLGSFVLLTVTYGRGSDGVQRGVSAIFSPVQSVADRALKPARDLVNWFDETFDARGRNSRLHAELEQERQAAVAGRAALAENEELRKLLELDRSGAIPSGYEEVAGTVIARSPSVWYADLTVDVGSGDGVAVGDPVVNGDGLVGSVAAVTPDSAKVTLIADGTSAVSARVVPMGIQGVVRPAVGDPGELILDFIDSSRHVHRGQSVVTAGWRAEEIESRFPPNIPIGEITKASILEQEAQQQVHVRPYADLRNLDALQVLTGGSRQ
ncbi:MAG TPA: rod shape-determining protein MreC [Solirubrobacterales bacterium]|nr:rod shape-determining protein MreC [Solirubrobacterales bacterium]